VRLTEAEIADISAHLGLGEGEFIQRHTRLRSDRKGLSLLEKSNGECEFLVDHGCSIQPVKPQQCRDFPNLWNFPGFEQTCHAISRELGHQEWRWRVKAATGRDPISYGD
jgi:Fe-S-cluster containining protein